MTKTGYNPTAGAAKTIRKLQGPFLAFRTGSMIAFALIAISVPEIGPGGHLIAAYCLAFIVPIIALEVCVPAHRHPWSQPLLDCAGCSVAVLLFPQIWTAAFIVGVMAANSRLLVPDRSTFRYIVGSHLILVAGMTFAAVIHSLDGWIVPVLATIAAMPAVLIYAHQEAISMTSQKRHEERMQSLRLLAEGVAHDFNNLLCGIVVNTEVAKRHHNSDHAAMGPLNEVLNATRYATMLTRQLRDMTSERMVSDPVTTDVQFELRSLFRLIRSIIPDGIELSLRRAGNPLPLVSIDCVKLQRVMMNLMLNSADAVEPPSTIDCELSYRTLDRQHIELVIRVVDRGCGIRERDLSRIFEPFVTSKASGSGIGLANAKRIVESEGGTITANSRLGLGTEMTVRLPVVCETDDAGTPVYANSEAIDSSRASLTTPTGP